MYYYNNVRHKMSESMGICVIMSDIITLNECIKMVVDGIWYEMLKFGTKFNGFMVLWTNSREMNQKG